MGYKFEKLDVWQDALEYSDSLYAITGHLPPHERFGLSSQTTRAGNSISLNIAEGSTGCSDAEQARFLRIGTRSLIETVGCLHLIRRRSYVDVAVLRSAYRESEQLFAKLNAFRRALGDGYVREDQAPYDPDSTF